MKNGDTSAEFFPGALPSDLPSSGKQGHESQPFPSSALELGLGFLVHFQCDKNPCYKKHSLCAFSCPQIQFSLLRIQHGNFLFTFINTKEIIFWWECDFFFPSSLLYHSLLNSMKLLCTASFSFLVIHNNLHNLLSWLVSGAKVTNTTADGR